ncbi:Serine/threonine protein kinase [Pelomyxa schiedti]|nr:Serine/threonine protein kinase [Pelomyxa schiedti]
MATTVPGVQVRSRKEGPEILKTKQKHLGHYENVQALFPDHKVRTSHQGNWTIIEFDTVEHAELALAHPPLIGSSTLRLKRTVPAPVHTPDVYPVVLTVRDIAFESLHFTSDSKETPIYLKSAILDGTAVSVKTFNELAKFRREATLLSSYHPNVVLMIGTCINNGAFMIVMETLPCDLFRLIHCPVSLLPGRLVHNFFHLGGIGLIHKLRLSLGIAQGLAFLHCTVKASHQDLRPSNLFVDYDFNVKIANFGQAILLLGQKDAIVEITPGTAPYRPPELQNEGPGRRSGYTTDIYALGVTIYEIMTEEIPFASQDVPLYVTCALRPGIPDFLSYPHSNGQHPPVAVPAGLKQLISECWAQTASERPVIEDVVAKLRTLIIECPLL